MQYGSAEQLRRSRDHQIRYRGRKVTMSGELMLKLDHPPRHLGRDRRRFETPALFEHLLVIGRVSGAVELAPCSDFRQLSHAYGVQLTKIGWTRHHPRTRHCSEC